MTFKNLKAVVDYALEQADTSRIGILLDDTDNEDNYCVQLAALRTILNDIEAEEERADDVFDHCYVVSEWNVNNMLNEMTYEDYARLYRAKQTIGLKDPRPSFDEYAQMVRSRHSWEMSDHSMCAAYEIIRDLFDDNEANGTPCDAAATLWKW